MRAKDVMEHFQSVGHWVDWSNTCDQFLHGDPDLELTGIATAWIPTERVIRKAAASGANLFITHEPMQINFYDKEGSTRQIMQAKRELLDELGMTVMRCHDTWDRMPEVGIPDAWAAHLGFEMEPRPVESFYRICLLGKMSARQAARQVLERVRDLGQDTVLIFGDQDKEVSRMAVGTGAITILPRMQALGADLLLATDDGIDSWARLLWAAEVDIPVLIVNHCTAEKPGMMAMAGYLAERFPGLPVQFIDNPEYPWKSVR